VEISSVLGVFFTKLQSSLSDMAAALSTHTLVIDSSSDLLASGFMARMALPKRVAMLRLRFLGSVLAAQAQDGARIWAQCAIVK
jgi:hypothetical protein